MLDDKTLIKIALDCGVLNYVDNETPTHYFIPARAEMENLFQYAHEVIKQARKEDEQLKLTQEASYIKGVGSENNRCVSLLESYHADVKNTHNYYKVAANLIRRKKND